MKELFQKNLIGVVALAVAICALAVALMKKQPKVAYAETSVLMSQFSEAIKSRKEFEEQQKEWDKNLKQINDSLVASMNHLKQNYETSSKQEQEAMRRKLDKWNSDLNRYQGAVKKMAQEKEQELMEPVINKVNSYLKQWGEERGYDMIFGTMTGGNILQANNAYNVTSELLADLNEHYKDLPKSEEKVETSKSGQMPEAAQSGGTPQPQFEEKQAGGNVGGTEPPNTKQSDTLNQKDVAESE